MASPGLEPETFSVLDWRDNQLHHDTLLVLRSEPYSFAHALGIIRAMKSTQRQFTEQRQKDIYTFVCS